MIKRKYLDDEGNSYVQRKSPQFMLCLYLSSEVYQLRPAVSFQITAVYQLCPRLLRIRVLAAPRGHLSGVTFTYQATEDEPIGSRVPWFDVVLHSGSS